MKYGLIGEKLGHSYSCQVHRALGNPDYELREIAPEALGDFLRARDFAGLNVTIPYKQAVIPYVDALTDTAREVGAVNTLYFDASGALWGDNTDVYGFCAMMEGIDVRGKKALVLGSGGTSHTACYALRALGAGDCIVVSRRGAVNYENVYSLHADAEVIVNATPVGMFPNNGARPIDIRRFPHLCAVADVIYNPARTALLQDADALGIPRAGGLSMLVAQAARSVERFSGRALGEEAWRGALSQVAASLRGVALVGMPGCGKSTIAQAVAKELGRACVDLDAEIEREAGKSIPEIFAQEGEAAFRAAETCAAKQFSRENAVLATGGGCVLRAENVQALRANSLVVWLKRAIDQLPREGRPLSAGNLYEMAQKRAPYYRAASDVQIENRGSVEEVAAAVAAALREGAVKL